MFYNDVLIGSKTINSVKREPGEKGEKGNAPVIYPGGDYVDGTTYVGNKSKAPYVYYNENYYIAWGELSSAPAEGNIVETVDWNSEPTNKWVTMETFTAIYSDIGVLKEALVGKWVFNNVYMFSQYGTWISALEPDYIGKKLHYTDVLEITKPLYRAIQNGSWLPYICFNARTGEGWFAGKRIHFDDSGELNIGGFSVTDDGLKISNENTRFSINTNEGFKVADVNTLLFPTLAHISTSGKAMFAKGNVVFEPSGSGNIAGVLSWEDTNTIKLGDTVTVTENSFKAFLSDDNYFELSTYTFDDGNKTERLRYKDSFGSGFFTSSCDGYTLGIVGPGLFDESQYLCNRSVLWIKAGDGQRALSTDGDVNVAGNINLSGELTSHHHTLIMSAEAENLDLTDYLGEIYKCCYFQVFNTKSYDVDVPISSVDSLKVPAGAAYILYNNGEGWSTSYGL